MLEIKLLSTLLIIVGLFLVLKIDPVQFLDQITAPLQKRKVLKDRVRMITGKEPGFIRKQIIASKEMLDSAGMGNKVRHYQLTAIVLGVIGAMIGMAIQNIMTAIVLALGLATMPIILIQIRTGEYIRGVNESMKTALSAVTSAYVQSGDLIDAVKTSIKSIPAPLDDVFKKFLVDVEMIDNNVVLAIHNMSDRVSRRYFKEWCAVLIQCQSDRELRYALPGIVERLSEMRQIQMEVDTSIRSMYVDYGLIVGILLGCIPIMGVMMPGWFDALLFSLAGKTVLTLVLLAIFLCTIGVVQSNRPIDMD